MFWRRQWPRTPVLLPGKSHGWRSLQSMGSLSWARLSYFTFTFHFHFSLSCIGEGNGNPLQCSCLGKPRDRGAWWAAVYGVAQSRTRLKWLNSNHRVFNSPACPHWIPSILSIIFCFLALVLAPAVVSALEYLFYCDSVSAFVYQTLILSALSAKICQILEEAVCPVILVVSQI